MLNNIEWPIIPQIHSIWTSTLISNHSASPYVIYADNYLFYLFYCNSVFLLFRCYPLKVDVVPSVLVYVLNCFSFLSIGLRLMKSGILLLPLLFMNTSRNMTHTNEAANVIAGKRTVFPHDIWYVYPNPLIF